MQNTELRFRQIHLDFHTSPLIEGIGANFDPDEFAETLVRAGVDSVTCFARCHHGMIYYDSKEFPERIHPHLVKKDLLKLQIEACHKRGIKVPVYITVQWDEYTAKEHLDWLVLDEKGHPSGTPIYEPGFYRNLCVNTPYRDFLKKQTKEILEYVDADGVFFDIVMIRDCSCRYCREDMMRKGYNPTKAAERMQYAKKMLDEFKLDMTEFVKKINPSLNIFYNASHIGVATKDSLDAYSHLELESLPSGAWGYSHFPLAARYARNLGLDCMAMTAKFHTDWADFHSFKNKEALEYECFRALALNCKCSIGDQLEPNGRISEASYDLIGSVYKQVADKEAWCKNVKPVTQIGVFTSEETNSLDFIAGAEQLSFSHGLLGACKMLEQKGHQFDIIDSTMDISKYELLILPDDIVVSEIFAKKLDKYLDEGGSIIGSYHSLIDTNTNKAALDNLTFRIKGDAPYSPDFIVPQGDIGKGLPAVEHVMYLKGMEIEENSNMEVLCYTNIPYFNRTWEHFCSHRTTPSSGRKGYPAIIKEKNVIYFAHPIFSTYEKNAPKWCKQMVLNAIELLLDQTFIEHDGPSTLMVTMNEQEVENRYIVHLLHYIPEKRSEDVITIEDIIPLYNLKVRVRVTKKVKSIKMVPKNEELPFNQQEQTVEFTVPSIFGHEMISIEFA